MTHSKTGSSPSYTSPSPIRSSPLTAPPHFSPARTPSPSTSRRLTESTSGPSSYSTRRFSQPASSLSRPPRSLLTPFTPSSPTPIDVESRLPPAHPASPPLSRSQPLLGSYQLSLLHSRMSRTQSHSVPSSSTEGFAVRIGAVGKGKTCPAHLRCPPPLTLPFSATYYDLVDPAGGRRQGASQTPWVGTIDLEQYYINQYSSRSHSPPRNIGLPPEHPGFEVAPIGQLQIVVKNATTPLRVFVVPYDLRSLAIGSRLLVRERTYVEVGPLDVGAASDPGRRKESLRYAIQLQFICQPSIPPPHLHTRDSSTTRRPRQSAPAAPSRLDSDQLFARQYYLSKSLKVIFSAQAPGTAEQLRTDRHDEVAPPPSKGEVFLGSEGKVVGFSPSSHGRKGSEDWAIVRQKWMARRKVEEEGIRVDVMVANDKEKGTKADLVSPTATSSPLPIFTPSSSYLPVIHSAGPSRAPSRPATPIEGFPRVVSPPPGAGGASLLQMSKPQGAGRKAQRQGSGSAAERELSEMLRSMDMKSGLG